jgi:hypothetical protein
MIKSISPKRIRLTEWEPDEKLTQQCHAALGLSSDGRIQLAAADKYVPPYQTGGKDAAGNQNRAGK